MLQKRYFPTIDGLRTLAVAWVVIFHAQSDWLPGGFIGVDVFFVISGFLITRNIVSEMEEGKWSFPRFYLRRIARLFPALFVTVFLTLVAAYQILDPSALERLGQASIFTVLSVSNMFFWLEAGYFDAAAITKPLLHTWSLSVEEQFYMFWPLMLFFLFATRSLKVVFYGLVVVGVLSLAAALFMDAGHPSTVFFLTPFRAYQFALGGLIGLIGPSQSTSWKGFAGVASLVGLVILVVGGLALGGGSDHIFAATFPALATGLILFSANTAPVRLLFGSSAAVWIGRRSYSIYLVHWPIMVLWNIKALEGWNTRLALASILASVLAGAALHSLVERPFRFQTGQSLQRMGGVLAGVVALAVAILTIGAHYWANDGYQNRVPDEILALTKPSESWNARRKQLRTGRCNLVNDYKPSDFDFELCARVDPEKPSYLIVGDSFASDAFLVLQQAYPKVHFLQMTLPGCQLRLPNHFREGAQSACRDLYGIAFERIARQPGLNGVILASNWLPGYYFRAVDIARSLSDTNLDIHVVGQHLRFAQPLPTIVKSTLKFQDARTKATALLKQEPFQVNRELKSRVTQVGVKFFDFLQLQCPAGVCDTMDIKNGVYYLDDSHLSPYGARFLAKRLADRKPDLFQSK